MFTSIGIHFSIAAGCSGTDGLGTGFAPQLPLSRLTAVTLKFTTLRARPGPVGKVRHDGEGYYLDAVGLHNPDSSRYYVHLPLWQRQGCPIGISLWGQTTDAYALLSQMAAASSVDYIELNLSCVNVDTPALTPTKSVGSQANASAPSTSKSDAAPRNPYPRPKRPVRP